MWSGKNESCLVRGGGVVVCGKSRFEQMAQGREAGFGVKTVG